MNTKPVKQIIPLAAGLAWTGGGLIQQKLDGSFTTQETLGGILAGETVGDMFTAFDCVGWQRQDVRLVPLRERLAMRNELCRAGQIPIVPETTERGGEFLQSVLDAGGEGVVIKSWDSSYFTPMLAAKRIETWVGRIVGFNSGQSVRIVDNISGQARGNLPLFGGRADQVRVGSVVKVEGFGLHRSGLIREPRICKDTATSWLIQY
ncbi:MAG: hypothetical protein P4L87_22000 [Formivibrio sp.]|nr:hypothetical protein [Formivibrio sp.]